MKIKYTAILSIVSALIFTSLPVASSAISSAEYYNSGQASGQYLGEYSTTITRTKKLGNIFKNDQPNDYSSVWRDHYSYDRLYMPHQIKATGKKIFIFSPKARQWAAYNPSGALVGFGRANGGNS